jgi:alkylhydroperoxidase family enzyme
MAWVRVVRAGEGDRVLEDFYASMNVPTGMSPGSPYDEMSLNPPALVAFQEFQRCLRHGPSDLTRLQREMIATYISAVNRCLL